MEFNTHTSGLLEIEINDFIDNTDLTGTNVSVGNY